MPVPDKCCSIVPYFKVHDGKMTDFKELCGQFVDQTKIEPKCMYYGFCFDGDEAHCREGYDDAAGVLYHLENVGPILDQALLISDLSRLEIHGPEAELALLRAPLEKLNPKYFILEYGFRR